MSILRLTLIVVLVSLVGVACGSGGAKSPPGGGVIVEPVVSATEVPAALTGGKPAAPPTPLTAAPPTAAAATAIPSKSPAIASASAAPASDGSVAPTVGRWIDVDVTRYRVRLMDGTREMQVIAPVAVGAQVDTGAYESTQTGLFHVYGKTAGLQYDPPYKTYIADWVAFDAAKANGFHSFLEDDKGNVVDASTGRVSNGCIRTGDSRAIFAFAEIGMPVYVHS